MKNNNFQLYRQKVKLAVDRYNRVRKDMNISFEEGRLHEIEALSAPFLKGHFTLAVIGKMSSGKSTFINAFLKNGKLLPTGGMQTTCVITEIIPSKEKKLEITYYNNEVPQVFHGEEIYDALDKTVKIPEEYSELPINKINSMLCEGYDIDTILQEKENIEKETDLSIDPELLKKYISSSLINNIPLKVVIYHPLDETFTGWKIIDTPGINADGGIEETTWELLEGNNDIEGNNVDAIIFVHNGNISPQDKTTRESIKSVFEKLTSEARKRIFFVITHASDHNFIINKERIVEYCKNQFKDYGVDGNKIIPVDSLLELLEKWRTENGIDPASLSDCEEELNKDFQADDCEAMLGINDMIKRVIRREKKEFNAENILTKINEYVGFPLLREQLNAFVKNEKENTYKKLIKTIEGDLKNFKNKKNEEREILNNRCTMSPEEYEKDINNKKDELKRLRVEVIKRVENITTTYSKGHISCVFQPVLNKFDDELRNTSSEYSITRIANLYKVEIENKQKNLIFEIGSKFEEEFECTFKGNSYFPLIDTTNCLERATETIKDDVYEPEDGLIAKIKRWIPFAPKSFGNKLKYHKGQKIKDNVKYRENVKFEFHEKMKEYCTKIYSQISAYKVSLNSELNKKVQQRESDLDDLLKLQAKDSENFKRIDDLKKEIDVLNSHLKELEKDTCI